MWLVSINNAFEDLVRLYTYFCRTACLVSTFNQTWAYVTVSGLYRRRISWLSYRSRQVSKLPLKFKRWHSFYVSCSEKILFTWSNDIPRSLWSNINKSNALFLQQTHCGLTLRPPGSTSGWSRRPPPEEQGRWEKLEWWRRWPRWLTNTATWISSATPASEEYAERNIKSVLV